MKDVVGILKSEDKLERAEGYSILFLIIGAIITSLGIGLSILNPKGLSTILAMLGALLSFLSTVALIGVWVMKEFTGE